MNEAQAMKGQLSKLDNWAHLTIESPHDVIKYLLLLFTLNKVFGSNSMNKKNMKTIYFYSPT